MCGIVAIDIQDISSDQIESVKNVLLETEVRGMHASGISWYSEGKVHTIKTDKPISDLLEEFDIYRCADENNGHLSMIAHIRYSTSNLEYNQPICDPDMVDGCLEFSKNGNKGDFALVHNGVITQADPSMWNDIYGIGVAHGENDSELLYMSFAIEEHPLEVFEESSMAVAYINNKGHVNVFRNGKRPLWISRLYNGFIATSTLDIIKRSEVEVNSTYKSVPGVDYSLTFDSNRVIIKNMEDLQ